MTERLNMKLNDSVHTVVDLGLREVSAEQGGLCGLAAIYQALDSTILTKSQLRSMSYEELVEVMADEMGIPINDARKKSDAEMLLHLHDCEFFHFIGLFVIFIFSGVCTDNEWKKVFNHDAAFGVFTDAEDVKLKSPFDPTAPLYSFLDNLDMLKKKEDPYHLRLCYPELTQHSFPCNEWIQSKNPLETTSGTNIDTAITITFDSNGANQNFKGLGTNRFGKDTRTIIDGSPTSSNWWFALGVKELQDNKIAGPDWPHWVSKVELFMKRTSPSPTGLNLINLLKIF